MKNRTAPLEAALEQLAFDFATRLVDAAFRARVTDLEAVLADRSPAPRARVKAARKPEVAAPAEARVAGAARGRSKPSRQVVQATPASRAARRRQISPAGPPAPHDLESSPDVITDPSHLLGVIGAHESAVTRPSQSRGAPDQGLFGPASRLVASSDGGPSLRPGERVQRTAAGTVVLRRRGK